QPPHLGFAAFHHLFPRIRWRSESHPVEDENDQPERCRPVPSKNSIQAVLEVVLATIIGISTLSSIVHVFPKILHLQNCVIRATSRWFVQVRVNHLADYDTMITMFNNGNDPTLNCSWRINQNWRGCRAFAEGLP